MKNKSNIFGFKGTLLNAFYTSLQWFWKFYYFWVITIKSQKNTRQLHWIFISSATLVADDIYVFVPFSYSQHPFQQLPLSTERMTRLECRRLVFYPQHKIQDQNLSILPPFASHFHFSVSRDCQNRLNIFFENPKLVTNVKSFQNLIRTFAGISFVIGVPCTYLFIFQPVVIVL